MTHTLTADPLELGLEHARRRLSETSQLFTSTSTNLLEQRTKSIGRGISAGGTENVLRRMSNVEGLLVAVFVAPGGTAGNGSGNGRSLADAEIRALALEVKARDNAAFEHITHQQREAALERRQEKPR
jgi:hypothetical protein